MTMDGYSLGAYERLLETAIEQGYHFVPFTQEPRTKRKCLLLRHDVDYSLTMAVDLARVNARHGVRGTFCLLLRGQVYNLLSPWSLRLAHELSELGQWIGLHYTPADEHPTDLLELASALTADFAVLRANLPEASPVVSWHNPPADLLARTTLWSAPGLVNAYHQQFIREVPYLSDSNFRNSCADFERALRAGHAALHLLFHPLNWVAGGRSMIEVFSQTWTQVLREREQEFLTNRVYRQQLPHGMSPQVLQVFAESWLGAARAAG